MPDVLYIHPAKHGVDSTYRGLGTPYFFMPVGVIPLANLLRQEGLTVKGINYPAELRRDRGFSLTSWIKAQQGVRLVMIDLHWYEHAYGAISIARACRQALPGARILLGGITASLYAAEILNSFPEVDFVIRGDAEKPLQALAAGLFSTPVHGTSQHQEPDLSSIPNLSYRSNGLVVENELTYCATSADLDELDFVDLEFLEHADWYGALQFEATNLTRSIANPRGHWLSIGRGCHFDCSFCGGGQESHRIFAGRKSITLRSVEKVVQDIQRLAEKGFDQVSLALDPAILGPDYWKPLFAQLRSRGVRIGINNEHFQLPSPEFIKDFVRTADLSRSELALSLLSGSEKVRQTNGKFYSNQKLNRTLSLLKQNQVPLFVYFSLNLPGEDEKAFRRTLDVAERIGRYYPPHLLKIINMMHTLDPCSPMSRDPGRFSIQIDMQSFQDYYDYCRTTLAAQSGVTPGEARGFTLKGKQGRSLESMVRQWDEFCTGQDFICIPVPQTW
jgi:tRNA A37 methylthiotransferase MiaB